MKYGERIRKFRQRSELSQAEVGKAVGVSSQAVSKWERGVAEPDSEAIRVLCTLFSVSADELLGAQKNPAQMSEAKLDERLVSELVELSDQEADQVRAFVAGLKASRKVESSHHK